MTGVSAAEYVFWAGLGLLVYSYVAYPVLLQVLATLVQNWRDVGFLWKREDRRVPGDQPLPSLALLVAAYNEEGVIAAKLKNSIALDYPCERWELLLGLDAPTDGTAGQAAPYAFGPVRVVHFSERRGKLAVIKDLAQATSADILVFSDANTMLAPDALRKLARHFHDPRVGAVVGELRVLAHEGGGEMESLYWKYELVLKFLESRLNCVMGANGAIYAVRRNLFRQARAWIIEDFVLPMEIRYAGHRVVYDPEAVASEEAAPTLQAEFRRRVRLGAGGYQTLLRNPKLLNPLIGMTALAYLSHKVLRWVGPLLMLAVFAASTVLVTHRFYGAVFAFQCAFYACALLGYRRARRGHPAGLFAVPFYFTSMNLSLFLGMLLFISGRHTAVWGVTARRQSSPVLSTGR